MDVHAVILLFLLFAEIISSRCLRALQPFMPNVCSEQERVITAEKQPCVQSFTRMVKVWRQGCTGHAWCMDYERRTAYYMGYRQVYRQDFKTTYKCCPGWSQLNTEAGCIYPLCTYGVCFNGGVCTGHVHQLCDCLPGFNGSSCQYGEHKLSELLN
ncbi:hypothetical protein R3I93_018707 [Phoxinus phoxinus]|uniref:Multiple epidermal growth factor-like domains protein 6 n=1 Tax=Phoxinus phoxinus TaxID=58324 RepID=A0AAN9CIV4_9TELE